MLFIPHSFYLSLSFIFDRLNITSIFSSIQQLSYLEIVLVNQWCCL